ncbi:hypothetical protein HAX54_011920 [Datura stramonium]|uniref:PPM-type phosphatase domain-containing protein n=1 Tax=Datura stramonium TaxID=4076 RepID=A0ABS8Y6N0_DATST|nr:hypothetical protein [Datura stramonium]
MAVAAAEAEILCQQSASVQYLCVSAKPVDADLDLFEVSTPTVNKPQIFREIRASEAVSIGITRSDSAVSCSTSVRSTIDSANSSSFVPIIRSGAYARFDGHGGSDAAAYIKNNAMRLFFEDADLPQTSSVNQTFLEELVNSHRRAFLLADQALADERSVDAYCGTTAITVLVLGRHLVVANAGDCRAVLCRKGAAVQMSEDHRPTCQLERQRVEGLGGLIEYGYLNGDLAVTRALGDWYMKLPFGSVSPLTAEPEVQQTLLAEEDEFMIIGCDGIWDVMSNQEAVNIVSQSLGCTTTRSNLPESL